MQKGKELDFFHATINGDIYSVYEDLDDKDNLICECLVICFDRNDDYYQQLEFSKSEFDDFKEKYAELVYEPYDAIREIYWFLQEFGDRFYKICNCCKKNNEDGSCECLACEICGEVGEEELFSYDTNYTCCIKCAEKLEEKNAA